MTNLCRVGARHTIADSGVLDRHRSRASVRIPSDVMRSKHLPERLAFTD
jgi:hypothetical protein